MHEKASPKGSQSQAKGQKGNKCLFVILMDAEIGGLQSLFQLLMLHSLCEMVFYMYSRGLAAD
jgi:hypothetical protein